MGASNYWSTILLEHQVQEHRTVGALPYGRNTVRASILSEHHPTGAQYYWSNIPYNTIGATYYAVLLEHHPIGATYHTIRLEQHTIQSYWSNILYKTIGASSYWSTILLEQHTIQYYWSMATHHTILFEQRTMRDYRTINTYKTLGHLPYCKEQYLPTCSPPCPNLSGSSDAAATPEGCLLKSTSVTFVCNCRVMRFTITS